MRFAVVVAAATLLPAASFAQGVTIEHSAIGCVVAGQYPVFNACFNPASELARARVYFRAADSPHWYYVDMKPDAPCFSGTLPRPKKEIAGLSYYVEATDRAFNAARTDETATRVVGNRLECQDKPVAPFVDKATVVVGATPGAPIVPLGFAAGGAVIPTAAVVGVAGAGAAAAGAVVATNNNDGTTTTVPGSTSPATTTPSTTTPTTTPTTTVPPTTTPAVNNLPTIVVDYGPDAGESPLLVRFNTCRSTDPENDTLRYTFDFEDDGVVDESGGPASCRQEHTYTGSPGDRFTARLCVNDRVTGHPDVCESVRVTLEGDSATCDPSDESYPEVEFVEPDEGPSGSITESSVRIKVTATDSQSDIERVDFYACPSTSFCGPFSEEAGRTAAAAPPGLIASDTTAPYQTNWSVPFDCQTYRLLAVAYDACGNEGSNQIFVFVNRSCSASAVAPNPTGVTWESDLQVAGASAQLVLNGERAFFPANGRSNGRAVARGGENRLEGQIVSANGTPGTWRLDLSGEASVVPGSLKVLAGEAIAVEAGSVTFRLQGRAGERVVVSFFAK